MLDQDRDVQAILRSALDKLGKGAATRVTPYRFFQILRECASEYTTDPSTHQYVLETLASARGTDISGLEHELMNDPELSISDIEALVGKVLRSDPE
jgi:hypothetical protein